MTTTENQKLLPCPFCGGEAHVVIRDVEPQSDPYYRGKTEEFAECKKCGCTLFDQAFHEGFENRTSAITAWNRRTPTAPQPEPSMSNEQLTHEQAIAFYEAGTWKNMPPNQLAAFQLRQDKLCMPFSEFHEAVEAVLGRPVFTYEFGLNRDGLIAEMEGKATAPSFEEILSLLHADKTVVVTV